MGIFGSCPMTRVFFAARDFPKFGCDGLAAAKRVHIGGGSIGDATNGQNVATYHPESPLLDSFAPISNVTRTSSRMSSSDVR